MALDAATLALTAAELKTTLTDAKIAKIFEPTRDELVITLRTRTDTYALLLSARSGSARVCLTEETFENPETPPSFCMLIRKHLTGGRLLDVHMEPGDRIVYFEKNLDGRITALKTNMSEINHLKTDILNIINDEILALDTADIGIPLGSLFLPEFFSGKGPAIPVHILSIRNSDATFESNFSQAGINQTLHQLNMIVSVDVSVLVMGETDSFTIHSEVVVAETVIIGDVPSTYLQTGGYYGFQREN